MIIVIVLVLYLYVHIVPPVLMLRKAVIYVKGMCDKPQTRQSRHIRATDDKKWDAKHMRPDKGQPSVIKAVIHHLHHCETSAT